MSGALLTFVLASACGGSASGPDAGPTVPLSSTGFATAGQAIDGPYDFTLPNVARVTSTSSTDLQFETRQVRVTGTAGVGPITVEIDGQTYELIRDAIDPNFAEFTQGSDVVALRTLILNSPVVIGSELFSFVGGNLNTSNIVIGYDTNPNTIAAETGTAVYTGEVNASVRNGFFGAFGDGEFQLQVDFGTDRISGTAFIEDELQPNADFTFDPIVLTLQDTTIVGNGFVGGASLIIGNVGGAFVDGSYDGRFFGNEAESIGGQITGRIDRNDSDQDVFVEAIFVGNQEDQ